MEFLLFGLGALSRVEVATVGLVSPATVPADGSTAAVVAFSIEVVSAAPANVTPSTGTTGSAITRLAIRN